MNVSFTRARSKLIILGSRKTLKVAPLLEDFFTLLQEREWIFTLPPAADTTHELFARTYPKRTADNTYDQFGLDARPPKRTRVPGPSEETLAKGRHILKDLFNAQK